MSRRRIVAWCAAALCVLGGRGDDGGPPESRANPDDGPDGGIDLRDPPESLPMAGDGPAPGGSGGDAGPDAGGEESPERDAGLDELDAGSDAGPTEVSLPPFEGTAYLSVAPGSAALRSASYRMQVQLGLSLGPQEIKSANVRVHGASAVVIREARP